VAYLLGLCGIAGAIVEALALTNDMYPVETGAVMKMNFDYITEMGAFPI